MPIPQWDVVVDDPDQAEKHVYTITAANRDDAKMIAARQAILDDPRGCGIEGGAELRQEHAQSADVVDAVATYAVATPSVGWAEQVAQAFHEAYERLAPEHGYETREASAKPWADVPEPNRRLMVATVRDLLDRGVIGHG